jgi:two-component system, sensor histidine kinase PdtaS
VSCEFGNTWADAMTVTQLQLADPANWRALGVQRLEIARLGKCLALAELAAARCAVMMREGDHRIKNSLQIVSSLMTLEARREENNPSASQVLRTAAARIQSVARMHDALQLSGGEDVVDLGSVLKKMCESLQAMGGGSGAVTVRVSAEPIKAPVAYAQPIVLAVNELVVNALRHAFPDGRSGAIDITLKQIDGAVHVGVADDGVGLAADHDSGRGYGMKLVHMMASQIGGALRVDGQAGTRFTVVAPAPPG